MTKREWIREVVKGNLTEEVREEARKELEKLEKIEEKRKSTLTERQKENLEVESAIIELVKNSADGLTVDEIGKSLEFGFARQRYTGICTKLVKEGKLRVEDRKIKNKGIRKIYKIYEV